MPLGFLLLGSGRTKDIVSLGASLYLSATREPGRRGPRSQGSRPCCMALGQALSQLLKGLHCDLGLLYPEGSWTQDTQSWGGHGGTGASQQAQHRLQWAHLSFLGARIKTHSSKSKSVVGTIVVRVAGMGTQ